MIAVTAPVLLVGCGKMGGALLKGWLDGGIERGDIAVVEPDAGQRSQIQGKFSVAAYATAGEIPSGLRPAAVVVAVKPQVMAEALPAYAGFSEKGAVFLSIAAGKKIAALRALLGGGAVVRAMPNLPAAVGQGFTVACAGPDVPAAKRIHCERLLSAVGGVAWIDDEAQMDAVTAVSGSGPGYVFLFVECLAKAGAAAGLEPGLAMRLARATVEGSGALLQGSASTAAELRESVTSKGGTTAAALAVLMGPQGFEALLTRAVAAAAARSRELSD